MTGMLTLTECDLYCFDATAAARAVKFIETYCYHYEGAHAGKPFILHPIQRQIVSDLFGWKVRATGRRRFTDCYFEAAVGAGKSPLLAAIGLFCLMADGEPGAQVFSLARSFQQARVVFDSGKKFAQGHPQLAKRLRVVDRQIRHKASGSVWELVPGTGPGSGKRASCVLADECHDWVNGIGYAALRDRMAKRTQPLMIVATNAGETQFSFCWRLREKAVAALKGEGDPHLYPIIFAADESDATDDPAAWLKANPLLGITIDINKVAANAREAMKDPAEEAKFRRLYLGIWPKQTGGRWLNMADVDACSAEPFNVSDMKDHPLYIGLDLALCDDLCSSVDFWITPDQSWLSPKFWIPHDTAKYYDEKEGFPYLEWAEGKHIELCPEPTISAAVHRRIANHIIARSKTHKLQAVLYDQARSHETIAILEAAGIPCVPMRQGYGISQGCADLERRFKERSIIVAPNPVFRFCCENAVTLVNSRGSLILVKPNANTETRYAGKRGLKIDGVVAAANAIEQARKHTFPAAVKRWQGFDALVSGARS